MGGPRAPFGGFLGSILASLGLYSIASRIPPGRFIWVVCVEGCWVVVFASVCMFVRSWGLLAHIWLVLGASWAPFCEFGRSLGHLFGLTGPLLGCILGVSGSLGLHFWGCGGPLAPLAPLGEAHWPPKVPKVKFSHFFPLHFGIILGTFWS